MMSARANDEDDLILLRELGRGSEAEGNEHDHADDLKAVGAYQGRPAERLECQCERLVTHLLKSDRPAP